MPAPFYPADQHKVGAVYAIYCTATKRVYIGQSRSLLNRWNSEVIQLMKGEHHNAELQKDYAMYGHRSFTFRVLDFSQDEDELRNRECETIKAVQEKGWPVYNVQLAKEDGKDWIRD